MGEKPAAIMLKKVLAVLALVLALGYAQGPAKFSTCGADALGVTGVIVDPNSPIPGKNLAVSLTIKPTQDIVDGDQFVITVKVFGVALGRRFQHLQGSWHHLPAQSWNRSYLQGRLPNPFRCSRWRTSHRRDDR